MNSIDSDEIDSSVLLAQIEAMMVLYAESTPGAITRLETLMAKIRVRSIVERWFH